MKKVKFYILGFISGILNGLFGSGGGLMAVPMLKKSGLTEKEAHATSIAIILPLSIISAGMLIFKKIPFDITTLLILIITGFIGGFIGSKLLKKIDPTILKKMFGVIMIVSGIRLMMK